MMETLSPHGLTVLKVKEFYRKYLKTPFIDTKVKRFVNFNVDILAYLKGMKFPQKFLWDWKLELLTNRFERETVLLFKKIVKPNMIALDLGGHIGYYARLLSGLVGGGGRVYVFEPAADTFELLKHNTAKCGNVELINKAICDKDGITKFHKTISHSGANSILEPTVASEVITVPCVTIDTFVKEHCINIDVIKMDIEGAEPLAFKGAEQTIKSAKNLLISMEFIDSFIRKGGQTPEEFCQYLRGLGFTIYKILPDGEVELFDVGNYDWQELSNNKFAINLFLKK